MSSTPHDVFPPGRWRGRWIWTGRTAIGAPTGESPLGALDPAAFDGRVLFRRAFTLEAVPSFAPFRVTSDSRHVLYVNGVEAARGPARHGPRSLTYDHGDAAPLLCEGENVVAVLARFHGHRTPWWEPTAWTFTLGGGSLVAELRAGDAWIVTDDSWRCAVPEAWTPSAPRSLLVSQIPEVFDARLLDPSWNLPGFDDRDWRPATVLAARAVVGGEPDARPPSDPFGPLLPRPVPALGAEPRAARTVATDPGLRAELAARLGARDVVVADFGQVVSGTLRVTVRGEPGAEVAGALLEVPAPAAFDAAGGFRYTCRGGDDVFEQSDPAGGRYAVLGVPPGARVERVEVVERLRPRPEGPFFVCDDPLLNEIHRVGLRTVDLTAHDAYLDCPTREQRAWTGDSVVHQSVDLVANPDWRLARHHPSLAAQPRPDGMLPMAAAGDFADPRLPAIPDWALHWIRSVHNLYRYTGDRALVAGLMPVAEGVLRWFTPFLGGDGLLHDVTGWVLIDWSPVQVRGTSAALNALYARGLQDFAEMAEWLGDLGRTLWARDVHDGVRRGFESFWDGRRYRDTLTTRAASEHTSAAAVCAGLVPAGRADAVRDLLLDRDAMFTRSPMGRRGTDHGGPLASDPVTLRAEPDWDVDTLVVGAQPFFRYVVHDALALLGAAGSVAWLCRDWKALLASGPTAFRECWDGGSYCHGWSATPSRDLLVHTLGVTPAEPGYARVRVAPRLGHLRWARGAVPSPHGLITVEADHERATVDSPVPVELHHPDGTTTRLPSGGTVRW